MNEVKEDESGQVSTEEIMGKFKAVIEVEVKEEKDEYFQEKEQLFQDMQDTLGMLAYSRGIKDFKLDLDKLETIEGREELEDQMAEIQERQEFFANAAEEDKEDLLGELDELEALAMEEEMEQVPISNAPITGQVSQE